MLARLTAAEHYDIRIAYLLLLPSVLYLLAMSVYPMVFSLWLAFRNYLIYRPDLSSFAGLGMGVLRTLLVIPVLVSPVAMGLTFRYMYAPSYGLINYLLSLVGLPRLDWIVSTTWALPAVIAVDVWQWTPFVVLILLSGMQSVPVDVIEASELDGLSRWQHLWRIIMPMIRPVVLVVLLIRLIDSIRGFDLIYILTRGGPSTATYLLSIHSYVKGFTEGDMGSAAAIAWITVVLVNILAVLFLRLLARGKA